MTACLVCCAPGSGNGYCSTECKDILNRRAVPRGTTRPDYPATAADWPKPLRAHESAVTGYEVPDPLGIGGGEKIVAYDIERRRERAAGYAHIARLAVDGGPIAEPKPIRRRYTLETAGLIGIAICALGAVIALWGVM